MSLCFAGIDVAKKKLAVALYDSKQKLKHFSVDNTRAGHRELARRLAKHAEVLVAIEATSNYSLDLCLHLHSCEGINVAMVNPSQAHSFKSASGRRAKTDPLDAEGLASFAMTMQPRIWTPPSQQALQLRAVSRRIAELVEQCTAEKNRREAGSASGVFDPLQASYQRVIERLETEALMLEQQALELIRSDDSLSASYDFILSMKGTARRSAVCLLGELSCLSEGMGRRQWVCFAGLDPRTFESGSSVRGHSGISRRGSPYLRRILYMIALVASQHQPEAKAWYQRLLERGKPPRLALVALMRKLLCTFWGMLKNKENFKGEKFSPAA